MDIIVEITEAALALRQKEAPGCDDVLITPWPSADMSPSGEQISVFSSFRSSHSLQSGMFVSTKLTLCSSSESIRHLHRSD